MGDATKPANGLAERICEEFFRLALEDDSIPSGLVNRLKDLNQKGDLSNLSNLETVLMQEDES